MTSIIFKLATIVFKIINPGLTVAPGAKIDPRAFPARGGRIAIGANSIIRAGTMLLPSGGSIEIGSHSSLNQYVVVNGGGSVVIGSNVMIAAFTAIFAESHRFDRIDVCIQDQGMQSKGGIVIEDDVWIGTHCVILDGVRIGRGSVIAAGSVVTKSVEPYSIVQGVPGVCVGYRGSS